MCQALYQVIFIYYLTQLWNPMREKRTNLNPCDYKGTHTLPLYSFLLEYKSMDLGTWVIQCGLRGSFLEEKLIKSSCACQTEETRTTHTEQGENNGRWSVIQDYVGCNRFYVCQRGREPTKARGTQEVFLEEEKSEFSNYHSTIHSFLHLYIQQTFIEGWVQICVF